jgi:hypothetical protein
VDTYKAEVAEKALEHGASIINDVSALTWEPDIVKPVIQYDAGLILNHMRGTPETWARMAPMKDVMGTLVSELEAAVHRATRAGVPRDRVVIDPGIGFGKRGDQNHEILARLGELQKLLVPVMVAASRKSFLGKVEDKAALEFATAAAVTTAILNGAAIVRVHDVAAMRAVVQTADAIVEATPEREDKAARQALKPKTQETDEERRRKPIRPVMKTQAPLAEQPPAPPAPELEDLPRRPFARRPAADEEAPKREERKAPTKKFFEWRADRTEGKPSDRRGRPERDKGDREDRRPPRREDDRKPFERRAADRPFNNKPRDRDRDERSSGGDRPPRPPFKRADNERSDRRPPANRPAFAPRDGERRGTGKPAGPRPTGARPTGARPMGPRPTGPRPTGPRRDDRSGSRGDRPAGGRPAFPPRDGERRGGTGRPAGPRNDSRPDTRGGDRPPGGRGGDRRPPFGGPKRGGGGGSAPPRGPRKRS